MRKKRLRKDECVLLLAPTNAALDRALESILRTMGINRTKLGKTVLRLGAVGSLVKDSYPEVCEDVRANRKLTAIEKRIRSMSAEKAEGTITDDEYLCEYAAYVKEKNSLWPRLTKTRIASARIVAMTVDSYLLKQVKSGFDYVPKHVFLDEAAYCPLIKAFPLVCGDWKLTLLGDHVQLPPVCLMPRTKDSGSMLWERSAAYIGELLQKKNMAAFEQRRAGGVLPDFTGFPCFRLMRSYRIGGVLNAVVSDVVYHGEMRCGANANTEVIMLNATEHGERHQSSSEAEIIRKYLGEHVDTDDFAVLTPYCDQVKLLNRELKGINIGDNVMTIHKAQGREWDTVILSLVDADNMYFCDTDNAESHGLQVVNTAITRAKQRLVIVCDLVAWSRKPGQLIYKLMQAVAEWSLTA